MGYLDRTGWKITFGRWKRAAARLRHLPLSSVRQKRTDVRALRRVLDTYLSLADDRLLDDLDLDPQRPAASDWIWRPRIFRRRSEKRGFAGLAGPWRFDDEVALFHDCPQGMIGARQMLSPLGSGEALFALQIDTFQFAGSYLSLSFDLPQRAASSMSHRHLLVVEGRFDALRSSGLYARLNIRHGPNLAQLTEKMDSVGGRVAATFDLAQTVLNEKRIEKAWVDILFENPFFNQYHLGDMTIHRRPRAEL